MQSEDWISQISAKWLFSAVFLVAIFVAALPFLTYPGHLIRPQTSCISNEKQLGLAFAEYMEDNDEKYPPGVTGNGVGWAGEVYSYVKQPDIYACPDDESNPGPGKVENSYGMNSNAAGISSAKFDSPASTVMLFEVENNPITLGGMTPDTMSAAGNGAGDTNSGYPYGAGQGSTGRPIYRTGNMGYYILNGSSGSEPRHNFRDHGGSYYLASDGHAMFKDPSVVSPGQNQTVSNHSCSQNTTFHGGACTSGLGDAASVNNKQVALTFSLR